MILKTQLPRFIFLITLMFAIAVLPKGSHCHQNQNTVIGEGFSAPVYMYVQKIIPISRKPHSNISQWLAWYSSACFVLHCKYHSCALDFPCAIFRKGQLPNTDSLIPLPKLGKLTECRSVPISWQIWVYFLQTHTLVYTIKLSNTLTGHNKNLPLQ